MNTTPPTTRRRRAGRRITAVGACAAAAATLGVGTAFAAPDTTTTTAYTAIRLVDEEHGLLLFANKSREDLCTPERIVYEGELQAWFDGGLVGDPPAEPEGTDVGEVGITETHRFVDSRELSSLTGPVPVEVWRLDEEGGGIDCTATDGAGAGLFATGTMDFTLTRRFTDSTVSGDTRLAGTVIDTSGGRWLSDVRYKVKNTGGHDLYVQPNIRLVPLG